MKKPAIPKKILDKRIPTVIGLLALVVALIAGIFFLGEGPGVFAPRATPTTTPQKIKVTNVTDNSFTISFLTDEATPGFVKYGTNPSDLNSQASDDRDQLSGTVGDYQAHHITVRGLQPTTDYYYVLGTGSNNNFDNNGQPFFLKTTSRNGAPAAAKTIYGSISNQDGSPAEGTIVYVVLENAGEMSSLVKTSGSWAVPLSNARTKDGTGYAKIEDDDNLILNVQGLLPPDLIAFNTTVAEAQPVPTLTFGQSALPTQTPISTTTPTPAPTSTPTATPETEKKLNNSTSSATTTSGNKIIDLEIDEEQTVNTSQPTITGKAAPGVTVSVQVNSETSIQEFVIADKNGNFTLDIASLSKTLEPGEHEVTYSYTDPTTGNVVTKTVNFFVENTQQLAQAPYGSGNPYPPPTPEISTKSAIATESATSSDEGRISLPATDEAVPVSGSVGTTLALVFGGLFFIVSGLWSFWISHQIGKDKIEF